MNSVALLIRLVNDTVVKQYDLSCVKQFNTGAAPLAPKIITKLEQEYPHISIRQAWGMTESCSCITITPPADQSYANAQTVGKVIAGTQLKIVDVHSGADAGLGIPGEASTVDIGA